MEFSFGNNGSSEFSRDDEPRKSHFGKKNSPKSGLVIGVITLIIGIVALVLGTSLANADKKLVETGVRTEGVVSNVEYDIRNETSNSNSSSSKKSKISKITTVSYTADNSQSYTTKYSEKQNNIGMNTKLSSQEDIGKKAVVFYDASDPSKAVVEGHEFSSSIGYILGTVFVLVGGVIAVKSAIALMNGRKEIG